MLGIHNARNSNILKKKHAARPVHRYSMSFFSFFMVYTENVPPPPDPIPYDPKVVLFHVQKQNEVTVSPNSGNLDGLG